VNNKINIKLRDFFMRNFIIKTGFLAFVLAIPFQAFAEDAAFKFDPYASIRAYFGYHKSSVPSSITTVTDDQTDLVYELQGNSRIGANYKVGDKITGVVELGLNSASGNLVYIRLANATYDFGIAKLEVGQDYNPYAWFANTDLIEDGNLIGFGALYDGRTPQVKISSNGFYLDFIGLQRVTTNLGVTVADTTAYLPKIAIGYDYNANGIQVGAGGAYNSYKINDSTLAVDGKTITSWLGYVHGDVLFGIIGIMANAGYGQNAGNFGLATTPGTANALSSVSYTTSDYAVAAGSTIKNSTHFEGYINPYVNLTPQLTVDLGLGYAQSKSGVSGSKADGQIEYTVDAVYHVDKNLSFSPTVSYRDYQKDSAGDKQGSEYYAGVKVQIDIKS
jgi:hypothetical protein